MKSDSNSPDNESIYHRHESSKGRLVFRAYEGSILLLLMFMLVRLYLLPDSGSSVAGPFALASMVALYICLRLGFPTRLGAGLLLVLIMAGCMIAASTAYGLNSAALLVLAIVPLLATLLIGRSVGWFYAAICCLVVIVFIGIDFAGYTPPGPHGQASPRSQGINFAQGGIIIMVIVGGNAIGSYYSRLSDELFNAIWQQANTDYLTLIPNRRYIDECLEREVLKAKRQGLWFSVLLIDVDHFKLYNDLNGHQLGDQCLRKISKCLQKSLFRPADIVGRYGGEEFIVMLPETKHAGAQKVAARICQRVKELNILYGGDNRNNLSVTIGAVSGQLISSELDPWSFVEAADSALYRGKHAGRDRVVFANEQQLHSYRQSSKKKDEGRQNQRKLPKSERTDKRVNA